MRPGTPRKLASASSKAGRGKSCSCSTPTACSRFIRLKRPTRGEWKGPSPRGLIKWPRTPSSPICRSAMRNSALGCSNELPQQGRPAAANWSARRRPQGSSLLTTAAPASRGGANSSALAAK